MKDTRIYARLEQLATGSGVRDLLSLVEKVFQECVDITKTVTSFMPEYTLHDEVHLSNVVRLMDRLLPEPVLDSLRPLELAGLILSAGFHDIGMAPSRDEVQSLLRAAEGESATEEQLSYAAFRQAYPAMLRRQEELRAVERNSEAQEIEAYILAEYLRENHADRSRARIFGAYQGRLQYKGHDFASRLAEVCASHTQDASTLDRLPCRELVGPAGEYCNWRFVALLLRLADILDFDPKRTPQVLFDHLGIRSVISVKEWTKHRSITGWDISPGYIAFAAQCPDPVIEKAIRDFVRLIEYELLATKGVLAGLHDRAVAGLRDQYFIELPSHVDIRDVRAVEGPHGPDYNYVDLAFHMDEDSIKSLLMGVRLYADRTLFLRELLQNAIDSCRHRQALHLARPELGPYDPTLAVRLITQEGREFLEVEDNGIGMDERIIRHHFSKLGASYYSSAEFIQERARLGMVFRPIAQFGIGVLSCFMVGDMLNVETYKFAAGAKPLSVEIAGQGALFWFSTGQRDLPGSRLRVRLSSPASEILQRNKAAPPKKGRRHSALYQTVAALAPHVGFPLVVESGRRNPERFRGSWSLPERDRFLDSFFRTVDVDLTQEDPPGLDGIARFFILKQSGQLTDEVIIEDDDEDLYRVDFVDIDDDLRGRLSHRFSYVQREHRDWTVKDGLQTGYSNEVGCRGTWSQQGIAVQYPLLPQDLSWPGTLPKNPFVPIPLPVSYDIDLSEDFVLPLSVDRNMVLAVPEAEATCARIAEALSLALLKRLGLDTVLENRAFFDYLAGLNSSRAEPFLRALSNFLSANGEAVGRHH